MGWATEEGGKERVRERERKREEQTEIEHIKRLDEKAWGKAKPIWGCKRNDSSPVAAAVAAAGCKLQVAAGSIGSSQQVAGIRLAVYNATSAVTTKAAATTPTATAEPAAAAAHAGHKKAYQKFHYENFNQKGNNNNNVSNNKSNKKTENDGNVNRQRQDQSQTQARQVESCKLSL